MSDKGMRFRPMLIGEVARVAGDPRETIRTRLKKNIYGFPKPEGGWKRFTDFETILISVHSRLKRQTNDDEIAGIGMELAAKFLMDEWNVDEHGTAYYDEQTFHAERIMFFWRKDGDPPEWTAEICQSAEEVNAQLSLRLEQSDTIAPCFMAVNVRTLLRRTLLEIVNVQLERNQTKKGRSK